MRYTEIAGLDAIQAAHHQIGNSLQSVASLLSMESRGAPPQAATILSEAGRRVRAIMRLHQRLQEGLGDLVRLDDLLGDICRDVAELDTVDRDAEIRVDIHPLWTPSRVASALAMITAEWVGNALEHGLADRAGSVEVTLAPTPDGARLIVSDDGVGARDGDWSPGFGLSLVSRLAAQVGGAITSTVDGAGSRFELVCPGVWSEPV
ncbi:MAG: sensor histidine kinase [Caulobacterales bacterium]|nr:sensor histidine kinase [Caulobacterales bacterium]